MIVLDTHVLLWWVSGDSRLSAEALATITSVPEHPQSEILVSAISAWEIALLVDKGRFS